MAVARRLAAILVADVVGFSRLMEMRRPEDRAVLAVGLRKAGLPE
jgi:class 3 adenylate cyclase